MPDIVVSEVAGKRDFNAFVDFAYALNADDPNWVPPLRAEVVELLTPGKNPFHEHARVQLFLARRGGAIVGRISAHYDELALAQPPEQGMGPGTGNWGLFEAADEAVADALIARAEQWLRVQGMTRVLAPISLSIWEEPGLLVKGHDHPPMVMMGHNKPEYEAWIEGAGYAVAKRLLTFDLRVEHGFPPLINRYEGGQSFGNHVDNAIRQSAAGLRIRTDLSATLFLAEPEEYDGGELVIEDTYGVHSVKLPAGHLVLYPSTSLHHVRPVTRGARIASFFWIQSMVRDDGERTLLFDLDTAIQRLNQDAPDHPSALQLTGVYHNLLRRWAEM